MVWNLSTVIETMMLSKLQTIQCEINTQFEVCYCNDLTLTTDKHLLNNESEMCVGPTADSPLKAGKFFSAEYLTKSVCSRMVVIVQFSPLRCEKI